MKLGSLLAIVILFSSNGHGACKFVNPKSGAELTIGQEVSMEVFCSPLEGFAWDYKKSGPTARGYFTPEKDTVRFTVQNKMGGGDYMLYLFDIKSRKNPESGLMEDYRDFSDSVSVHVKASSSIKVHATPHSQNGRNNYSRNLLGRFQKMEMQ